MHHFSKLSVHYDNKTENILIGVGVFSVITLLCFLWYHSWVKPNDERMRTIIQCMDSKYAERHRDGELLSPLGAQELDMAIYAICANETNTRIGRY